MENFITYQEKNTWIHRLSGVTKLIFFLAWSVVGMVTYDTRILVGMCITSFLIFYFSKTDLKQLSMVLSVIGGFLVLNVLAIFLFSPYHGTKIYGSKTVLFHIIGPYSVTKEQLFYELNIILKYLTLIPAALIFFVSTNPSEFAASLNKIGVRYNIGYAISMALRYIPDVQNDFQEIKTAQEARGMDMSKDERLRKRIKKILAIIFPLIYSSMERIDVISNAMELRGFGKHRKRTWYASKKATMLDYICVAVIVLFVGGIFYYTIQSGTRFYNPFK